MPYQLIVSFSFICLAMLVLANVQFSPFSLDVPSPRRVSFHLFQSLLHVPSPFSTAYFTVVNTQSIAVSFDILCSYQPLHLDMRWCTVSLCCPCNLHLSHSTKPLIFLHALVSIIFPCNANIDDIFVRSLVHFNHPGPSLQYCFDISI